MEERKQPKVRPEMVEKVAQMVRQMYREREQKQLLENYQPPKGSRPQWAAVSTSTRGMGPNLAG